MKGSVNLFEQNHPAKLMRQGHFCDRELKIGFVFNALVKPERASDNKINGADAAVGNQAELSGKLLA